MLKSFAPIINKNSKILILGSMPGIKSLEAVQYYAHPQNRFWKIMSVYCNYQNLEKENYKIKTSVLLKNNIALWDVIQSCTREGSLDTNIQNVKPNNIIGLIKKYPGIKKILCNGTKSYELFVKNNKNIEVPIIKVPSTSPANAKYSFEKLKDEWINAIHL
ncbi:DNA-deoxyinosine glycosylase [bacterium]|nr:DNA-deoxyinosine glycosylase [bacterium]